jgi:hypothetical protein
MTVARRLVAAGLVAAGLALLAGPGLGLIAAGIGYAWSGIDTRVARWLAVGVRSFLQGDRQEPTAQRPPFVPGGSDPVLDGADLRPPGTPLEAAG